MIIAALCGSLRRPSANFFVLEAAAVFVRQSAVETEVVWLPTIELVPPFREGLLPDAVVEFTSRVEQVDGVLIAATEYAGGLSGATKTPSTDL